MYIYNVTTANAATQYITALNVTDPYTAILHITDVNVTAPHPVTFTLQPLMLQSQTM